MNEWRYRLALAGLLHDIGKFAYRAEETFGEAGRLWKQDLARNRQEYGYYHAYLGSWFSSRYVPRRWEVDALIAHHHRPGTHEERIIALADSLSAGERENESETQTGEQPIRQIRSIFGSVSLHDQGLSEKETGYLPLAPLALKKSVIFPYQALSDEEVSRRYRNLWQDFCQEVARLKEAAQTGNLGLPAYLEAMQALMMRYTWAVPSAYWKTVPDVSLYDHSRMTAALAVALSDCSAEEIQALTQAWHAQGSPHWEQPVALLVGGDISGIQDFIYTIAAKGAAKMLRGRSFYLQLLTEAVLRYVLRELDLPYTSVIYSGGGNFYLLAPLSAQPHLEHIQADIARILLRYHGTDLYLVLGWAEVPLAGFAKRNFPDYWAIMHRHLQERKQRKYAELGGDFYQEVFQVPPSGGNPDAVCAICGNEEREVHPWRAEREEQADICTLCRSFAEDLGQALPYTKEIRWAWVSREEGPPRQATWRTVLRAFGAQVALEGREADRASQAWQRPDVIWFLEDPKAWPQGRVAWPRYTVQRIPMVTEDEVEAIKARLSPADLEDQPPVPKRPKTFTHLQVQTQGGFHRLGVLRMDVDDLGLIFAKGLGEQTTLSRLAALSFQMSLFFEGWVKRILEDPHAAWHNLVYTVYSGGDDLFLIGPWDVMPDLALRIVDDFTEYTGGHPALHLSGGMAFIHGKYPIYQAAEDAGEAEEQAKALPGKNAFAFLGRPWRWEDFRGALRELKSELRKAVEESGNKAVLRVVQHMAALARALKEQRDQRGRTRVVWTRWMWLLAYQLTRLAQRDEDRAAFYQALQERLTDYEALQFAAYAARWAELELRE